METRRWGSGIALVLAISYLIPAAGQKQSTMLSMHSPSNPLFPPFHEAKQEVPVIAPVTSKTPEKLAANNHTIAKQTNKRLIACMLTAYTAGYESTGKRPGDPGYGITASGKPAREGWTIAVDPTLIPIGSRVYIEGIGERIAEDTGGAIKGAHIDIFFNDAQTAIQFGVKKNVPVYVIEG